MVLLFRMQILWREKEVGITFNCTWDIENGVGVRLLNEKVMEVGYQDIIF